MILPTGTLRSGPLEYNVEMNGTPGTIAELNDLPVKTTNSSTLYMRDVAHIRDGFAPQTNIVRQDGNRGALMSIYKNGNGVHAGHRQRHQERCTQARQVAAAGAEDHRRCSISRCLCAPPSRAWSARRSSPPR